MTLEQMRAEAARVAREYPAAGHFVDGQFVPGPNTKNAIAYAILAIPIPAPTADVDDLVRRLRALVIIDDVRSDNQLGKEAADTITRLAARVKEPA